VELDAIRQRLRPDTLLVSVMHANNETGVLQPILEIGECLAGGETLYHVDAAQSFGKEVETLRQLRCDFLTASAHKIYGPKGVGVLISRRSRNRRLPLTPLMYGGGQERGWRPGTLPVAEVVGLGMAAALAQREFRARWDAAACVMNISFSGVDSEALMLAVRSELAISNGSACTSAGYAPSHVLKAMGFADNRIAGAVRISWGPGVMAIPMDVLADAVQKLRG